MIYIFYSEIRRTKTYHGRLCNAGSDYTQFTCVKSTALRD